MQLKKLAVICPGIGYTEDKPLLYHSRRIAEAHGYEILTIRYSGLPKKVRGDRKKMEKSYTLALEQTADALSELKTEDYDEILFIGKSIGTAVAAAAAEKLYKAAKTRFLLFTPLEQTFSFHIHDAIVFTGDNDPWVGGKDTRIPELCKEKKLPYYLIPGGNHSLETNEPMKDLIQLLGIMETAEKYISAELQTGNNS